MKRYIFSCVFVLSLVFASSADALYFQYEGGGSGNSYSSGYSSGSNYSSGVYALSQTLTASCAPMQPNARAGETVSWYSSTEGGTSSYKFYWSGTDGLIGDKSTVQRAYSTAGEKYATLTVSSGGQTITVGCTRAVSILSVTPAPVAAVAAPVKKVAVAAVKEPIKIASAPLVCENVAVAQTAPSTLTASVWNTGINNPILIALLSLVSVGVAIFLAMRKTEKEEQEKTAH